MLGFVPPAFAGDCYPDCMNASNCWGPGAPNDSYCSGTQVQCSYQCSHQQNGGKSYGAIAYSAKDGGYGYSDGQGDQKQAEKTALKYCKQHGKKCESLIWFYNSCGAVAADGKKVGWAQHASSSAAQQNALQFCRKQGGKNCEIKVVHCSR